MAKDKKYYVIFKGHNPGVYDDWGDARDQVEGYPNPVYKGYGSAAEAAEAYRRYSKKEDAGDLGRFLAGASSRALPKPGQPDYMTNPEVDLDAWAVDASCLGNPGKMEYQGVELMTGRTLFRIGPFEDATNNIGEFLAIVHAMALMTKEGRFHNIYSDSVSGMAWVRNGKIKTQLKTTPRNGKVFELMARAVTWLHTHQFPCKVLKWQTDRWGEIPADFGRK
ncbi:viroplasmin family protein [Lepagella muris]|uniref:Ribonuclease H n=1 Tax=Lepagella muris TaxID=3032870 RepID=A0AC61RC25_9BACT|nr:ribonuclease H family protein [Lepagella muris]ROT02597.1 ribonuclease H [Muribaculaceae bacterium Isolate-037 (Harlan)]TGY76791.1 ribonuclease H [Lepagella muris]THG47906.1 ribonuclease H [Bacteroidales bacterium]TKC54551.1 ribonuclease H [Bacteroidales bacterium]